MPRIWRWDQGRLSYFNYDNLRHISQVLVDIEGIEINVPGFDPLRLPLEIGTGMPFSPASYKVWRNYKRVFECALLASNLDNRLYVSDICKKVATEKEVDVDEYLSLVIPRFRFPFPAFQEYDPEDLQIYPFCVILKYLIGTYKVAGTASLTLEETFGLLIGNDCTGQEAIKHYQSLTSTGYSPAGDEHRQVREMLIYISQLSILKWHNGRLMLDITEEDLQEYDDFAHITTPLPLPKPSAMKEAEFATVTKLADEIFYPFQLQSRENPVDSASTEGKRVRVTHVKIERSPLLRRFYFEHYPETICDMCKCDTRERYPWTDNLLEIHHLLPLSSALIVTREGTSLDDVVPLCPTCHRSVHIYYKQWLGMKSISDFKSKDEAGGVYKEAKRLMIT